MYKGRDRKSETKELKNNTGNIRSAASRDNSHSTVPLLRILDSFNCSTMEMSLEVNNILIHFTLKNHKITEF